MIGMANSSVSSKTYARGARSRHLISYGAQSHRVDRFAPNEPCQDSRADRSQFLIQVGVAHTSCGARLRPCKPPSVHPQRLFRDQ
jgi:hypothetical protein